MPYVLKRFVQVVLNLVFVLKLSDALLVLSLPFPFSWQIELANHAALTLKLVMGNRPILAFRCEF